MNSQDCCVPQEIPEITIGYGWVHTFTIDDDNTGFPVDLSTASQITASYKNLDGSVLVLTLIGGLGGIALISGPGGTFSVTGTDLQSAPLALGNGDGLGNVFITYTIGGLTKPINLENVIKITDPSVQAS